MFRYICDLKSFNADAASVQFLSKGDYILRCTYTGNRVRRTHGTIKDCFGNVCIDATGKVVIDCYAVIDTRLVAENGRNYYDYYRSTEGRTFFTPCIRQVVRVADYNKMGDPSLDNNGYWNVSVHFTDKNPITDASLKWVLSKVDFAAGTGKDGFIPVKCPGAFTPIVPDGYIAVSGFVRTGANWVFCPIGKLM